LLRNPNFPNPHYFSRGRQDSQNDSKVYINFNNREFHSFEIQDTALITVTVPGTMWDLMLVSTLYVIPAIVKRGQANWLGK
jgi:hypothetical protein